MSTARIAIVALLVACSSKKKAHDEPPPPSPPPPPAVVAKAPTACVPKGSRIAYASGDNGKEATICFGQLPGDTDACVRIDRDGKVIGSRTWAEVQATGAAPPPEPPAVSVAGRDVSVWCGPFAPDATPCATLQIPAVKTAEPPTGAASTSRRRVFLMSHEREGWFGDTYDLRDKKRLAHVPLDPILEPEDRKLPHEFRAELIGDGRVLLGGRIDGGPGDLYVLDPIDGKVVVVGHQNIRRAIIGDTRLVVFEGTAVEMFDVMALRSLGKFTVPGQAGRAVPWGDRILVAYDQPLGVLQIDPTTATAYTGPPLPLCP